MAVLRPSLPACLELLLNNSGGITGPQVSLPLLLTAPAVQPPPEAQAEEEVKLSPEQSQILETVKRGGNIYFTGPAGEFGSRALIIQRSYCVRSTKERGNQLYSGP